MTVDKKEKAQDLFMGNYSCAQSVFGVFADETGLDQGTAFRISSGFGGGIGKKQMTCGAVTGAIMALGLKYGQAEENEVHKKELTYQKTQEFIQRFEEIFGTTSCIELVDHCDFNTPEGRKAYEEGQYQIHVCSVAVKSAVMILEDILKK